MNDQTNQHQSDHEELIKQQVRHHDDAPFPDGERRLLYRVHPLWNYPLDSHTRPVSTEVEKLLAAVKGTRNAVRDRCLLLLMFRHGLRVSEACGLKLSQVDTESRVLHVARLKQGLSTTQPLRGDELRAIKAWLTVRTKMKPDTDAFFISERRKPLSRKTVWLAIRTYGQQAGRPLEAYPHMLRHACGFALADQRADTRLIQDYLGHRNSQHTVRYTATNPARFERLWR